VAHCARRGEEDLTWKRMVREVEDEKSKWWTKLKEEWKALGVKTKDGATRSRIKAGWHPSWGGEERRRRERRRPETRFL